MNFPRGVGSWLCVTHKSSKRYKADCLHRFYLTPRPRFECPLRGRYPCTDDTLRGRLRDYCGLRGTPFGRRDCGTRCGTLPLSNLERGSSSEIFS
jgi:hypothetical protein